ncbi:hypothetical protein, partial [Vibrio sp.]|uniref:hypothetical protein n=1 Tax=Vibrio sp. TaxID=678 RepID=UPI0037A43A86
GNSFFNITSFLSCEKRDTITLYRPNWLNFNSDNYPARGGGSSFSFPNRYCRYSKIRDEKSANLRVNLGIKIRKKYRLETCIDQAPIGSGALASKNTS